MSSEIDGKEVLYPGVGDGVTYPARQLTQAEALDQYRKTKKSFGSFKDVGSADAYAKTLHEDQAKYGNTGGDAKPRVTGRMTRPPSAPKTAAEPKAGRGRITAPPVQGGVKTLTTANREGRVSTEEKGMYDKATNAYQKQLNLNRSKAADPASLQKLNEQAMNDYNAAKAQIVLWKAGQIRAVGGDPWKHQARNDKGVTIGTMDGVHWVDVTTGYPVQE
jgi:hypothetical protein